MVVRFLVWILKIMTLKVSKVCIIQLDHIWFQKSSLTFWQVLFGAHILNFYQEEVHPPPEGARTEHDALVKKSIKIFSNFVAFSDNPNFKSWKQNITKFSHPQKKKPNNFCTFFALASKSGWIKKIFFLFQPLFRLKFRG